MKKILFVLAFVLFVFNANSQWYQKYGVTSINELGEEQLKFSLQNAKTNNNAGKILTFTGLGAVIIGTAIGFHAADNDDIDKAVTGIAAGGLLMVVGIGAIAVGIPFWIVGARQRNQIEVALIRFNHSSYLGNYQPATLSFKQPTTIGLSLKVNF
jgi:hypothetical protein